VSIVYSALLDAQTLTGKISATVTILKNQAKAIVGM